MRRRAVLWVPDEELQRHGGSTPEQLTPSSEPVTLIRSCAPVLGRAEYERGTMATFVIRLQYGVAPVDLVL